ncbi:MAG: FAD-dependent oxidoreductase [Eggerthellaceae bacterium]
MGVAASSFLAGCSAPTSSSNSQEWDQEADVVVVGAGGAGLAAAIEAANAGASVLLLEKASAVGRLRAERRHLGRLGHQLAKEQGITPARRRVPLVHASSRMVRTEGSRHRARAGRQERRDDRLAAGDGRAFPEE